jgi:cob(I)alamin adenosyltransferase
MSNGRFRFRNTDEDISEARRGLEIAQQIIAAERHDLIVLDEIITCVMTELLKREQVEELLALHCAHPKSELALTGRGAWPELIDSVDLVTEMNMIRHYFNRDVRLRRGIDH